MEGEKHFIKLLFNLFGKHEQIFPKLSPIHGTCDPITSDHVVLLP